MKKIKLIAYCVLMPASQMFAQSLENATVVKKKADEQVSSKPQNNTTDNSEKSKVEEHIDVNRPAKTKVLASVVDAPANPAIVKKYEYKGTKFEKVPLLHNVSYFGKNYEQMLTYTQKYAKSRSKTFAAVQQRNVKGNIFNTVDKIFDKHDIPHEMKYLSVIESALNPKALSPVGAFGPWQFMPSTGQMMGLTVNAKRDDRSDWSKSTHAACKYLTYLHNMFDDWLLVVASYNSGPRPVLEAIKKTGKSDFWSIKKYLPAETQNHVMAFVATATVFEHLPQYVSTGVPDNFDWSVFKKMSASSGLVVAKPKNPLAQRFTKDEIAKMSIVKINKPLDFEFMCLALDMDRMTIERWNYDVIDFALNYKHGDTYNLRIPKDKLEAFIEKRELIYKNSTKL